MCVRFYVLNHSKYRFLFNAVYIGIMNGIRKPTFHAARYNRVKYLGSAVRSRPLQSAPVRTEGLFLRPHGCNIAYGKDPPSKAVAEVWPSFFENFSAAEFSPHLRRASWTFVRQIGICPTKVLALRGRAFSRVERLFNRYYGYQPKTDRHDRKEASNTEL